MQKPLISIIIPAYNHQEYIQEAIKSAIDQSYQNLELIIIDDGSKDKTFEKMQEIKEICKERFVRHDFLSQNNKGICETLNSLIKISKGEFIFLLASDDKIGDKNTIEIFYNFLSQNQDYSLVVGNNLIMDKVGKICYWDKLKNNVYEEKKARHVSFSDFLIKTITRVDFDSNQFGSYESLIQGNYIPNGYLIRTEIFGKIGCYTKEAPLEDWWLMLQISKYAKFKYMSNIDSYIYRWHQENTASNAAKMIEITLKTLEYEINLIKKSQKFDQEIYDLALRHKVQLQKNLHYILQSDSIRCKKFAEKKTFLRKLKNSIKKRIEFLKNLWK